MVMVIVGPWLRILVTATQTPTSAATIGITQTGEILVCFLATARDWGTGGSGVCCSTMYNLLGADGVPDKTWVKGLNRKHRQHHHRGEEDEPRSGFNRHQRLELDQGCGKSVDEHVDHR